MNYLVTKMCLQPTWLLLKLSSSCILLQGFYMLLTKTDNSLIYFTAAAWQECQGSWILGYRILGYFRAFQSFLSGKQHLFVGTTPASRVGRGSSCVPKWAACPTIVSGARERLLQFLLLPDFAAPQTMPILKITAQPHAIHHCLSHCQWGQTWWDSIM